jgi:DNA-binding Xre family transcriptional regulator
LQSDQKGESLKPAERFKKLLDKYQDDPRFVAEGLLIDIDEKIVHLMQEKEITRTRFAGLLGVSRAHVTKLLNGNENLTIKQLVRMCVALDCGTDLANIPRQFKASRRVSYTPGGVKGIRRS